MWEQALVYTELHRRATGIQRADENLELMVTLMMMWRDPSPPALKILYDFKAATQPHTALNTSGCFGEEYPIMRVLHTQLLGHWDAHFPADGI